MADLILVALIACTLVSLPGCARAGFDPPAVPGDGDNVYEGGSDAPVHPGLDGTGDAETGTTPDLDGGFPSKLEIVTSPVIAVGKNNTYFYDAEVNKPDPVVWTLSEAPAGMTIDASTGAVSWSPSGSIGVHPVTIRAARGIETAEQSYDLHVVGGSLNGLRPESLASLDLLRKLPLRPLGGSMLSADLKRVLMHVREARQLLRYTVNCALPSGTGLWVEGRGRSFRFEGGLGLAPEWQDRPCGTACQEWVSACVYARMNTHGFQVPIVLSGAHPGLGMETLGLPREGAFFGNLFSSPRTAAACRGPKGHRTHRPGRECHRAGNRCDVDALGACDEHCTHDASGIYVRCTDRSGRVFDRPVTVLVPGLAPPALKGRRVRRSPPVTVTVR